MGGTQAAEHLRGAGWGSRPPGRLQHSQPSGVPWKTSAPCRREPAGRSELASPPQTEQVGGGGLRSHGEWWLQPLCLPWGAGDRGHYSLGTPHHSRGPSPWPPLASPPPTGEPSVWAPKCEDGVCPPLPKEPTSVPCFPSPGLGRFGLICTRASQQTLICNKTTVCVQEQGFQTQRGPDSTLTHSHTYVQTQT